MPYITKINRNVFDKGLLSILGLAVTPGELNYLFTMLANDYIKNDSKNYQAINDAIGALECAKQELYSRVVIPYEACKCKENGDVY
jgi:hypothetical protein